MHPTLIRGKIRWKRSVRVRQVRNYQDSLLHNTSLYTFANDYAKVVDFIDIEIRCRNFVSLQVTLYMVLNRS